VPGLMAYLAEHGLPNVDRRTIYADIALLKSYGMDIEKRRTKTHDYYLAARDFELAELKLLVDAVQASRFITEKKSARLIAKLEGLTSRHQAKKLSRQVYVRDRVKTDNERVYYSIDAIHEAIAENRRIRFQYCQYTLSKALRPRRGGAFYEVSPYLLAWADDNYYLIADHPVHEGLVHFRVDKMLAVSPSPKPRARPPEAIDPAAYARSMFAMYAGERRHVELRFDRGLAGAVIDRFGRGVSIVRQDESSFSIRAEVAVSPAFFGWLLQFGGLASIESPAEVRSEMARLLDEARVCYNDIMAEGGQPPHGKEPAS
ncbi:MAG: WYL domain-containing transcriptional regulator, partial [Clostridia bacterium]|nr:WYL domain-containing transcriptional regulator [Clostridia bacterium]